MRVCEVKGEHIQKLFNHLIAKGYAVNTLYVSKGVLSGMFRQLIKNDVMQKNPVQYVEFPRQPRKRERRVLSEEEQMVFLGRPRQVVLVPHQVPEEIFVPLLKLGKGVVIQVPQRKGVEEGIEPDHRQEKHGDDKPKGPNGDDPPKEEHNGQPPIHKAQIHLPGAGPASAQKAEKSTLFHGVRLLSDRWCSVDP